LHSRFPKTVVRLYAPEVQAHPRRIPKQRKFRGAAHGKRAANGRHGDRLKSPYGPPSGRFHLALLMSRSTRPILKTNGTLGTWWSPLLSLLLTALWFAHWRCGLMRRAQRCHARLLSGLRSTLLLLAALLAFCLLRRWWRRCHARLHARRSS